MVYAIHVDLNDTLLFKIESGNSCIVCANPSLEFFTAKINCKFECAEDGSQNQRSKSAMRDNSDSIFGAVMPF